MHVVAAASSSFACLQISSKKFCFMILLSFFKASTDLCSQMLTAKDYMLYHTFFPWEHLTEQNNGQTNWQNVGQFFCFLIEAILYFFLCSKPQLAVLMHSWWLMTGVLSDHGILMATYPWLSKAESTESRLGTATAAVCLPNGQVSAHSLSVSPKFLSDVVLFIQLNNILI